MHQCPASISTYPYPFFFTKGRTVIINLIRIGQGIIKRAGKLVCHLSKVEEKLYNMSSQKFSTTDFSECSSQEIA